MNQAVKLDTAIMGNHLGVNGKYDDVETNH